MTTLKLWSEDIGELLIEVPDDATDSDKLALAHAAQAEARAKKQQDTEQPRQT
jgi:hypothetical protein